MKETLHRRFGHRSYCFCVIHVCTYSWESNQHFGCRGTRSKPHAFTIGLGHVLRVGTTSSGASNRQPRLLRRYILLQICCGCYSWTNKRAAKMFNASCSYSKDLGEWSGIVCGNQPARTVGQPTFQTVWPATIR